MTITVLPMDATAGLPTYSAQNTRQAQAAVYGAPTGAFSARSGWRVGTATSVVSVTSTTWTLNPCSAMISPAAVLYQGSYGWATSQALTGGVTAADGTNPRLDILYIQINDSSAGDGSGGLSAPVLYVAGAPTATPVAPTLPPRSFLVATISVPKAGGGAPTATLNQQYFVAAGAPVPVNSQAERDALSAYETLEVIRKDKGNTREMYTAGAWVNKGGLQVPYTPVLTATTTNPNLGSGVATGLYQVNGQSMTVQFFVPFSTTGNVGSGAYSISLPPGYTYGGLGSAIPLGTFQAHLNAAPSDISGHCRLSYAGANTIQLYRQADPLTVSLVASTTVAWTAIPGTYMAGQITIPLA